MIARFSFRQGSRIGCGTLVWEPNSDTPMTVMQLDRETIASEFTAKIADAAFPCVGAKSALAQGTLKIVAGHSIESAWDDVAIHRELLAWAQEFARDPEGLRSLAIVFEGPLDLDEQEFERAVWTRLQSLADKDSWLLQPYDDSVSADPDSPHFSLSFGGQAFFVVGLHPGASRPARRFPRPAMVFNLHAQFERLREEGRYERMREKILQRDEKLAGDRNPMLARHGETSEARQYSGRAVGKDWACPFHDPRASA